MEKTKKDINVEEEIGIGNVFNEVPNLDENEEVNNTYEGKVKNEEIEIEGVENIIKDDTKISEKEKEDIKTNVAVSLKNRFVAVNEKNDNILSLPGDYLLKVKETKTIDYDGEKTYLYTVDVYDPNRLGNNLSFKLFVPQEMQDKMNSILEFIAQNEQTENPFNKVLQNVSISNIVFYVKTVDDKNYYSLLSFDVKNNNGEVQNYSIVKNTRNVIRDENSLIMNYDTTKIKDTEDIITYGAKAGMQYKYNRYLLNDKFEIVNVYKDLIKAKNEKLTWHKITLKSLEDESKPELDVFVDSNSCSSTFFKNNDDFDKQLTGAIVENVIINCKEFKNNDGKSAMSFNLYQADVYSPEQNLYLRISHKPTELYFPRKLKEGKDFYKIEGQKLNNENGTITYIFKENSVLSEGVKQTKNGSAIYITAGNITLQGTKEDSNIEINDPVVGWLCKNYLNEKDEIQLNNIEIPNGILSLYMQKSENGKKGDLQIQDPVFCAYNDGDRMIIKGGKVYYDNQKYFEIDSKPLTYVDKLDSKDGDIFLSKIAVLKIENNKNKKQAPEEEKYILALGLIQQEAKDKYSYYSGNCIISHSYFRKYFNEILDNIRTQRTLEDIVKPIKINGEISFTKGDKNEIIINKINGFEVEIMPLDLKGREKNAGKIKFSSVNKK